MFVYFARYLPKTPRARYLGNAGVQNHVLTGALTGRGHLNLDTNNRLRFFAQLTTGTDMHLLYNGAFGG